MNEVTEKENTMSLVRFRIAALAASLVLLSSFLAGCAEEVRSGKGARSPSSTHQSISDRSR